MVNNQNGFFNVDVLTIHFGVNYGSVLQTYALQNYLNKHGYKAKLLDYIPHRYDLFYGTFRSESKKYLIPLKLAHRVLHLPAECRRRKIFQKFLDENVAKTKRYRTRQELLDDVPQADFYLCGSDQVWNDDYNREENPVYYFDFLPESAFRVSYAASFGKTAPLPDAQLEIISPLLKRFRAISVRESSALDILAQCQVNGIHVIDPTMLLEDTDWNALAQGHFSENYILIYVMDHQYKDLLDKAEQLQKVSGYKIYTVSFKRIKDKRIDRQFTYSTPQEFLALVRDAQTVITNSFHGTVFSILFYKRFIAVNKGRYGSRIGDLLDKLELRPRYFLASAVLNEEDAHRMLLPVDYQSVEEELNRWRDLSEHYLYKALSEDNPSYKECHD